MRVSGIQFRHWEGYPIRYINKIMNIISIQKKKIIKIYCVFSFFYSYQSIHDSKEGTSNYFGLLWPFFHIILKRYIAQIVSRPCKLQTLIFLTFKTLYGGRSRCLWCTWFRCLSRSSRCLWRTWFRCLSSCRRCLCCVGFVFHQKTTSIDIAVAEKWHHDRWPGRGKGEWRDLWILWAHCLYTVHITTVISYNSKTNFNPDPVKCSWRLFNEKMKSPVQNLAV